MQGERWLLSQGLFPRMAELTGRARYLQGQIGVLQLPCIKVSGTQEGLPTGKDTPETAD